MLTCKNAVEIVSSNIGIISVFKETYPDKVMVKVIVMPGFIPAPMIAKPNEFPVAPIF